MDAENQQCQCLPFHPWSIADCAEPLLRFGSCFSTLDSSSREGKVKESAGFGCSASWLASLTRETNGPTQGTR